MQKELVEKPKKVLLEKKKKYEQELVELNLRAKNNLTEGAINVTNNHPADYSPVNNIPLSLISRKKKLIAKCKEALKRLERGEYGICAYCHCEIPIARLQSVPITDKCIECKQEIEEDDTLCVNGVKHRISEMHGHGHNAF